MQIAVEPIMRCIVVKDKKKKKRSEPDSETLRTCFELRDNLGHGEHRNIYYPSEYWKKCAASLLRIKY